MAQAQIDAIGVVEVQHFTTAIEVLDTMTKAADVQFLSSEKLLGGKLVTVIVGGGISQVTAAIEAVNRGQQSDSIMVSMVISKPHEELLRYIVPKREAEHAAESAFIESAAEATEDIAIAGVEEAVPKRTPRRRQSKPKS